MARFYDPDQRLARNNRITIYTAKGPKKEAWHFQNLGNFKIFISIRGSENVTFPLQILPGETIAFGWDLPDDPAKLRKDQIYVTRK